jgi:hypothetical protein
VIVQLSTPEMRWAMHVGADRFSRLTSRGLIGHELGRDNYWQASIVGAWGECVVAKATGLYWCGDLGGPDGGAPDVGPYHVRTAGEPTGRLILRDDDADDAPFVLVVPAGAPGRFQIVGSIDGRDGKQPAYLESPAGRAPAYFVPHSALRPLEIP